MQPPAAPFLTLVTDESLPFAKLETIVERACRAAPIVVQLRAKSMGGGPLLEVARRLREITSAAGSLLSVNDRIDVALACGADGVHLPAAGMSSVRARALIGRDGLVGRSAHSLEEIERERAAGAVDYVQFGPVFATPSKAAFGPAQGVAELARAVERARPLPVVAIGGIDDANVAGVIATGVAGIAVIRAVMQAADPGAAARCLIEVMRA